MTELYQHQPLLEKNDRLPIQEYELRGTINALARETDGNVKKVMEIAKGISTYANQFDYVVVSGGSGKVSKTLLMATEVPANKIITFDPEENATVYQQNHMYASSLRRPLEDRVRDTKAVVERHGISQDTSPSFLIVDDHIDRGVKAEKYAEVFVEAFPDSQIGFASFSALRVATNSGAAPTLSIPLYLPPQVTDFEYRDAQYYIHRLAFTASQLNRQSYHRESLSEETIQVGEIVLRDQLKRLYYANKQLDQA